MSRRIQKTTRKCFGYVDGLDFDWEVAGTAVAWIIMVFSILQPSIFVFFNLFAKTQTCVVITVIYVFNLLMTIHWLYGIILKHSGFMLTTLLWWLIVLSFWLYVTATAVYDRLSKGQALYHSGDHTLYAITAVGIVLYSIAVKSYVSMRQKNRRQILEIQRFDQVFMLAPVDHKTIDV